jgi:hypothetical protein
MNSYPAIIIGLRGDSLTGDVHDPFFEIDTTWGVLKIPADMIERIHYKNGREYPEDVILTVKVDKHSGKILQDTVHFTAHTGQELRISRDRIHTIFFTGRFDRKAASLPG